MITLPVRSPYGLFVFMFIIMVFIFFHVNGAQWIEYELALAGLINTTVFKIVFLYEESLEPKFV